MSVLKIMVQVEQDFTITVILVIPSISYILQSSLLFLTSYMLQTILAGSSGDTATSFIKWLFSPRVKVLLEIEHPNRCIFR